MRWKRTVAGVVVLAALFSCGNNQDSSTGRQGPAAVVTITTVSSDVTPVVYEAVGSVRSRLFSTIASRTNGTIKKLHAREGDLVEAGALLAEIDDRTAAAAVTQAQAGLSEAEHAAAEVSQSLHAAEAAREAAEANRQLAEATFNRMRTLNDQSAISRQQFDEAEAKYRAAAAEARRAGDELEAVRARQAQVGAKVEQAKANLDQGDVNYSYTRVDAPFSGKLVQRYVDAGDLAIPGTPLFDIEDADAYRLEVSVSEAEIARVNVGDTAMASVGVLGAEPVPATVAEIVPAAEQGSRSFLVKLDLPDCPALRPGMYGKALFTVSETGALLVLQSAVVSRGQLQSVFVVDEKDIAHMRLVKTGKQRQERVEILSGLNAGERIVADGAVSDGQQVVVQGAGE